ncbi:hypothetical protein MBLNU459_g5068t2 [Dothideomycetes sp. NU459]
MGSDLFNVDNQTYWPLFTTVDAVRSQFSDGTAIMIAIGGWGDTQGFSRAAASDASRKLFATNIKAMLEDTGADGENVNFFQVGNQTKQAGVDIDWEYPGGNGEDYRQIPNSEKAWEIDAYPSLLSEIREALGPDKIMSAAVPGLPRDMIAFTKATTPVIGETLDFLNIMTYDLMNRRDNTTKHHTGLNASQDAINAYIHHGLSPGKANLGFAFYVKWFKTDVTGGCSQNPIGCKTAVMEDPETGADLGQAGAFSWHDQVPKELRASFQKALAEGEYDSEGGGHYFWDDKDNIFWSWDTPQAIEKKIPLVVDSKNLGGVFAWGLGEDAPEWSHLTALNAYLELTQR